MHIQTRWFAKSQPELCFGKWPVVPSRRRLVNRYCRAKNWFKDEEARRVGHLAACLMSVTRQCQHSAICTEFIQHFSSYSLYEALSRPLTFPLLINRLQYFEMNQKLLQNDRNASGCKASMRPRTVSPLHLLVLLLHHHHHTSSALVLDDLTNSSGAANAGSKANVPA
jgi:hypothetical protein